MSVVLKQFFQDKKFKSLRKGDIVDIVFPSNHPKRKDIKDVKKFIKSIGLKPRIFEEKKLLKTDKNGYLICSNELKANQLYKALKSKDSKLVWSLSGGYGSGELIPYLRNKKKIKQKKLFIGYSDIDFIATFLQKEWSWKTLNASMLSDLLSSKKRTKKSKECLLDILFGKIKNLELSLQLLNKVKFDKEIKSKIIGGCLSILLANFGTKNQIKCKGEILFLEDIGESGFRLIRKFNQIADYIIDNKQIPKAILLGSFFDKNSKGIENKKSFNVAIEKFDLKLKGFGINVPIFHSENLGHTKNMLPLLLGNVAKISL